MMLLFRQCMTRTYDEAKRGKLWVSVQSIDAVTPMASYYDTRSTLHLRSGATCDVHGPPDETAARVQEAKEWSR